MNTCIKWLAILLAGVTLNAGAVIFTDGTTYGYPAGSMGVRDGTTDNIVGDGGSYPSLTADYLLLSSGSTLTVATNGTVTANFAYYIGDGASGSRLVLQSGSTLSFGGNVYIGDDSNGNVMEIQRGAAVSIASTLEIGRGSGTGNSLILGEDISGFSAMYIDNGNTIAFDGGTSASTWFSFSSGALVEITGSYGVGDELVAANGAGAQDWNELLTIFNAAGAAKGYVFDLTTANATGVNSIIVAAVPEPASVLMLVIGAGTLGLNRRRLHKETRPEELRA